MDAPTSTSSENENPVPDYLSPEEELSSGNNRLALIVGAIVVLVLVGYLLLPAQVTRRISAAMPAPVMELGEATVTGARASEDTVAATEAVAAAQLAGQPVAATVAKPAAANPSRTTAAPTASKEEEEEPALAVAPTVLPAALEPVEVAPTMVIMNGRVLDENGRPLAGATIMLRGSKSVASTDAAGNYSLEVPASGDNTLLYGYGGYEDQLLRTRNAKNQNVTLVPKETSRRRRK
ncbi:carboxypeptidase-like regulatory domain-containing protein [Hymenobacter amundsenii]|nr:carboxypeptidase-like regulatory domain-containing protein [Hymenobacter amundsenii]